MDSQRGQLAKEQPMKKISRRKMGRAMIAGSVLGLGAVAQSSILQPEQAQAASAPSDFRLSPVKTAEEYQVAAAAIVSRTFSDPEFAQQMVRDPLQTLLNVGIGNDAVRQMIAEDDYLNARYAETTIEINICFCTGCCCTGCCVTTLIPLILFDATLPYDFGSPSKRLEVTPERAQLLNRIVQYGHVSTTSCG
jgi:hypothetical protein